MVTISAENHQAQQVVKAFGLRTRELDRFTLNADRHFRASRRMTLYGGLFGLIVNSLVTLLRLAVLGVGAWLIFDGKLTIGGLVAFLSIMGEVISPITSLVGLGQQLQTATGALMRVNDVLHAETETQGDDDRTALAPIADSITFDAVSKTCDGPRWWSMTRSSAGLPTRTTATRSPPAAGRSATSGVGCCSPSTSSSCRSRNSLASPRAWRSG